MSVVKVQGNVSGTGAFTIAAPATNTDRTLTLPDNTGTLISSGTAGVPIGGPAFSARNNANQSVSNATFTKVQLSVEDFDTNNNFDTSTYRFTPTVAGYYMVTACIPANSVITRLLVSLYKNGSEVYRGTDLNVVSQQLILSASTILYMNGSTDYLELYVYLQGGTQVYYASAAECARMSACLIRSAV